MHAPKMAENTVENLEDQLDAINTNRCIFKEYLDSCEFENQYADKELTAIRKQTIITKSIHRADSLRVDINKFERLVYHTNCYLNYTSNQKIARHLKRKNSTESTDTTPKRLLRGSTSDFNFKTECLFCGEKCAVEADPKNPKRFKKNPGVLCRTADRGSAKFEGGKEVKGKSFKQVILDVCNNRSDEQAETVRVRLEGAPSDLHAVEAR